mgnify:CR=1 FL=1
MFRHVSLQINSGEFFGVIGHTGSGKSTVAQILAGLLTPSEGRIFIDGEEIEDYKAACRALRRRVGIVFQYPEHQLFEETVYKDIAFGPTNMGLSKTEIDERVRNAAKYVGIPDEMLGKSPFDLSGGEKRRVAIAGVISMEPEILILDEVLSVGDGAFRLKSEAKMTEIIGKGATTILVSHSLTQIRKLCNKVLWLDHGKQVAFGETQSICDLYDEYLTTKVLPKI